MSPDQPSTSRAGAASVPPSPSDEPDFVFLEPSPRNRRELPPSEQPSTSGTSRETSTNTPRVEIIEQPARYRRFRYKSEVDSAGSIRGENSTEEHKTYPTIRILEYLGRVIIIVFPVTKDSPGAYKVHPACLVGEGCRYNILTTEVDVTEENRDFEFNNLRIQYVSSDNVEAELKLRQQLRIDPFKQGYGHKRLSKEDLHAVRLCFHVFKKGASRELAPPVVSNVIYDSKFTGDLQIREYCDFSGPITGGTKILFLSKQVTKDDIEVFFYQMEDGAKVWEAPATNVKVFDKVGISCVSPPYDYRTISDKLQVMYHLRRPSHNSSGSPAPFIYLPEKTDDEIVKVKRRKSLHPTVLKYIDWQPPVIPPQEPFKLPVNQDWNMNEPQPGPSRPSPSHPTTRANCTGAYNTRAFNRQHSLPTRLAQLEMQPGQPGMKYVRHGAQTGTQFAQPESQFAQPEMQYAQQEGQSAETGTQYAQQSTPFAQSEMQYAHQEAQSAEMGTQFAQQGTSFAQPESQLAQPEMQYAQPESQFAQPEMQYAQQEAQSVEMRTQFAQQATPFAQPESQFAQPEMQYAQQEAQSADTGTQFAQQGISFAQPEMQYAQQEAQSGQMETYSAQQGTEFAQPEMQYVQQAQSAQLGMQNLPSNFSRLPSTMPTINENNPAATDDMQFVFYDRESQPQYGNQNHQNPTGNEFDFFDFGPYLGKDL
uniref:RHD domain-containing protein n=1 Tax=Heliothis virescens TaxID=7102 RepID=A0A2A4K2T8_HELVI